MLIEMNVLSLKRKKKDEFVSGSVHEVCLAGERDSEIEKKAWSVGFVEGG